MKTKIWYFALVIALVACSTSPKGETSEEKQYDITGTYEMEREESEDCAMKLVITEERGKYHFHLTTTNRDMIGELIIDEEDGELTLILPDIVWDDFKEDALDDDIEGVNKPQILDLEFYFDKEVNSLNMQNYGNSMNSYIVFSECGGKFIELKKKIY